MGRRDNRVSLKMRKKKAQAKKKLKFKKVLETAKVAPVVTTKKK